ncbi:MAG: hemerythrin domain-containing protein [bacterium]
MSEFPGTAIKDIIDQHSKVGDILIGYGIDCAGCSVGTCMLKEIVAIHALPENLERDMMEQINAVLSGLKPETPMKSETSNGAGAIKKSKFSYSPPLRRLVDEHTLIKRMIALIPDLTGNLDLESESGRQIVLETVDFIRHYADTFHHAKEEEILFKYFDESNEIIQVMLTDHTNGRNHVKNVLEGIENRDKEKVNEHLTGYMELLTEHIKKEDEILYPWMDRELSDHQVGELHQKFNEADKKSGQDVPVKYSNFVDNLENSLR